MAKFVIDRRNWYRGKGNDSSNLLLQNGKRCCIGFVGQQCGVSDEDMFSITEVELIQSKASRNKFPHWLLEKRNNSDRDRARVYEINDAVITGHESDRVISEEDRESQLKRFFKNNGDEIEFIN